MKFNREFAYCSKRATGMSLWLPGQCLTLSLPVVYQAGKEIYKRVPVSSFAQQVDPIRRREELGHVPSLHLTLNPGDMFPVTQVFGCIDHIKKRHKRDPGMCLHIFHPAYVTDVENKPFLLLVSA